MTINYFGFRLIELDEVHRATEVIHRFPEAEKPTVACLLEMSPLEAELRPTIVLTVGRLCHGGQERLVALAAMVQLLFLSVRIHAQVREDAPHTADDTRLAILIGDYYLSRFFALAASSGLNAYIRPFSEIVCRISEGTITRLPVAGTPEAQREALRQETAVLMAAACRMAGEEGGASADQKEDLYRLGYYLGMGYGLMERGLRVEAREHLLAARTLVTGLPADPPRDTLDTIIDYLLNWPAQPAAGLEG